MDIDKLHNFAPLECATPPGPTDGYGHCWGCNSTALSNTQRMRSNDGEPAWCLNCIGAKQLLKLPVSPLTPSQKLVSGFLWDCSIDDLTNLLAEGANPNTIRQETCMIRSATGAWNNVLLWNANGTPQYDTHEYNPAIPLTQLVFFLSASVTEDRTLDPLRFVKFAKILIAAGADVAPAINLAEMRKYRDVEEYDSTDIDMSPQKHALHGVQLILYGARTHARTSILKEELIARALHLTRVSVSQWV